MISWASCVSRAQLTQAWLSTVTVTRQRKILLGNTFVSSRQVWRILTTLTIPVRTVSHPRRRHRRLCSDQSRWRIPNFQGHQAWRWARKIFLPSIWRLSTLSTQGGAVSRLSWSKMTPPSNITKRNQTQPWQTSARLTWRLGGVGDCTRPSLTDSDTQTILLAGNTESWGDRREFLAKYIGLRITKFNTRLSSFG